MRKLFLLLLFLSNILFAQPEYSEKNIITVISSANEIKSSADIFKTGIESILTGKGYTIVNPELDITQCKNDVLCYIKIAKLSKAENILTIETIKLNDKYLFKTSIINVSKNGVIMSYSKVYENDINDFSKILTFADYFKPEITEPKSYSVVVSEQIKEEIKETETENTETTAEETTAEVQTEEVATDETPQETKKGGLGLKVSLGLSTITGDDVKDDDDVETQSSYDAGLLILTHINDIFSIQTELLFSKKGYSKKIYYEDGWDEKSATGNINYYYGQFGLSLCIDVVSGLKGYFGGYYSYLISAGITSENKNLNDELKDYDLDDLKDSMNEKDYGFMLGVMYKYSALIFDLRYSKGLKELDKDGKLDTFNEQYMISAGFIF